MLQQYAHHPLDALGLHRLASETQQMLQGVCGAAGFTQIHMKSCRFTGFG